MKKGVAGTLLVFAFNKTTNDPVSGDSSNISCNIRKDYSEPQLLSDSNPIELSLGFYEFTCTSNETNADVIDVLPESSTSNVIVIGVPGRIFTETLDLIKSKVIMLGSVIK